MPQLGLLCSDNSGWPMHCYTLLSMSISAAHFNLRCVSARQTLIQAAPACLKQKCVIRCTTAQTMHLSQQTVPATQYLTCDTKGAASTSCCFCPAQHQFPFPPRLPLPLLDLTVLQGPLLLLLLIVLGLSCQVVECPGGLLPLPLVPFLCAYNLSHASTEWQLTQPQLLQPLR